MSILEEIRSIKSDRAQLRGFGLTLGIVFGLLGGLFFWRGKDFYRYFLILGGAFLLVGVGAPVLLKPVHKAWMTLAALLGWLMTRVILTLVFYVVFTPFGLIGRRFGSRFLELGWDRSRESYWIPREPRPIRKSDYERPF